MVLLALLVAWLGRVPELVPVAIVLLLLCMVRPGLFHPLAGPWLALSHILGAVSSRVVLTVLFFTVVTPVGVLRRMLGADPMQAGKWKRGEGSVFRVREHRFRPEDLEKPY
jgi:hypothetical protein